MQLPFECIVSNYPATQFAQLLASLHLIEKSYTGLLPAQNSWTGDQILNPVHSLPPDFSCSFGRLPTVQPQFFWPIRQQRIYHRCCTVSCNWSLENMLLSWPIPLISPTHAKSLSVKQSIINCTTNQGGGGFGCTRGLKYS